MGDILLKILIVEYVAISAFYAADGDGMRSMYFAGATILSLALLHMK